MMPTSEIFQAALDLLGPNGEFWMKGHYSKTIEGRVCYCAMGAILTVRVPLASGPRMNPAVTHALSKMLRGQHHNIVSFNDAEETTFEDVKRFFEIARDFAQCGC